jgi:hypothetical protein
MMIGRWVSPLLVTTALLVSCTTDPGGIDPLHVARTVDGGAGAYEGGNDSSAGTYGAVVDASDALATDARGGDLCAPGSVQCSGNVPQTCSLGGQWQNGAVCPYLCTAGKCTGTCTPSSTQCSGNSRVTCDATGAWGTPAACPFVCSKGACSGVCSPGATRCNANSVETCDGAGTWQASQQCPFVCANGTCDGSCVPGAKQCSTNNVVV